MQNDNEKRDQFAPEIRFRGFSDEWEERPLLNNFEKIIDFRGRTPKKLGLDWSSSGYLALSALNVKNGYIDLTVEANYGDQELYDKWMSGNELHKNQVLFTTEAPMGNVAQIPDDKKYILSQRTIAFEVKSIIVEDFLAVILVSPLIVKKLLSLSSGGTAKGVSQKSLANIDLRVPKNIYEQTKIGDFFQQIDRLISQHQQKHDKLLNIKKALLEKMFPRSGKTEPEIRFKGFSEEWNKKELGMVADRYDNLRVPITAQNRIPGNTPYYGANGIQDYVRGYTHDGEFILVAEDGANDLKNYPVQYVNGKIWVNNHAHVLQAKRDIAQNYFLKYTISQTDIEPFLVGGGRAKLNADTMMKIVIRISPNTKEQTKIGNFFQQLDRLISQHQTQIQKLNHLKQAFLSKMFV